MSRLLIVLLIIAVIAIILYLRREQQARAVEQQRLESSRRLQEGARVAERAPIAAASTVSESAAAASGRLQEAADRAAGVGFERATEQMEGMTANLAEARRDADLTAARLSSKANDALAAVQTAAAAHGGAVPGDGTSTCPPGFPVKGVLSSKHFHEASSPGDDRTIADVCFQSAAAAAAAGFLSAPLSEAVVVEEIAAIDVDATAGQAEVIVADAVLIRDRENGARGDIVAQAIAAADAGGVPPGAIRGDGGRDCPPTYAIKGNRSSMLYHEPGTPTYESTVPEFCFSSVESATAAGFSATRF